jgi:cell division protein FtsZ
MKGARGVLINITGGYDMTLFELDEAANEIRSEVADEANIIVGSNFDETLDGKIRISVVAAGLDGAQAVLQQSPADEIVENNSEEAPLSASFVAPIVVTNQNAASTAIDERPDFEGRELPAAHMPPVLGHDRVSADMIFPADEADMSEPDAEIAVAQMEMPEPDTAPQAQDAELENENAQKAEPETSKVIDAPQSGFGSLFGWRRNAETPEKFNDDAPKEAVISSPDDHPEPAPFDDADLEIPAFLRRSANH